MKLGVMVEAQEGLGWEEWRTIVRAADRLGFESLWRSDHFFSLNGSRRSASLETFVSLAYAATHSEQIRFGPLVCSMTFRHPALLARMAAALDQLSCGRFELGIGAGWFAPEHAVFGIHFPPRRVRAEALAEGANVIRKLLSEDGVSFRGQHYTLQEAQIEPKPVQKPLPLLIGGGGEKLTLPAVARWADEWNVPGLPLARYRSKAAALAELCRQIGRDSRSIQRSIVYTHAIAPSEPLARALADQLAQSTPPQYRPGAGPEAPAWLVGTPDQVVREIHSLAREGVSRVILQYRVPPTLAQLELVAREILPHV